MAVDLKVGKLDNIITKVNSRIFLQKYPLQSAKLRD